MKTLTREDLKGINGGSYPVGGDSQCSSGICGPEGAYNCSTIYNSDGSVKECCCGHSSYNDDCLGS